jgi:hypothetical protein
MTPRRGRCSARANSGAYVIVLLPIAGRIVRIPEIGFDLQAHITIFLGVNKQAVRAILVEAWLAFMIQRPI